jgi:crotonobetainyl-CoA:carnitine CoA-transferase CaiB-like acyl-CoA transferase
MKGEKPGSGEGPCAGIKVLDLATMVSGPMCGRILGDLGADVIKLEGAGGDMIRTMPPHYRGMSAYFSQYNRNKRSIVVDLKSAEGQAIAQQIVAQADVLIENFRPGVASRLGLDYEPLKQRNPRLIYVSVNGFGDDGPYADLPAYDPVIQGLVGFMHVQGRGSVPVPIRNPVVDKVAAMSAALAILAALNHRHARGGVGQRINVRMLDAWAAFILPEQMNNHTFQSPDAPKSPARDVFRIFETSDGHVVGLVLQDSQFRGVCAALGRHDLESDPRFADPAARVFNIDHLHAELCGDVARMTTEEFLSASRQHDVPFAPANDIEAFFEDPQVKHNGTYVDVEDPEFGSMRHLSFMAAFGAAPAGFHRRAPKLGEHTDEVLSEFGYSKDAIGAFRSAGLVR